MSSLLAFLIIYLRGLVPQINTLEIQIVGPSAIAPITFMLQSVDVDFSLRCEISTSSASERIQNASLSADGRALLTVWWLYSATGDATSNESAEFSCTLLYSKTCRLTSDTREKKVLSIQSSLGAVDEQLAGSYSCSATSDRDSATVTHLVRTSPSTTRP